MRQRFTNYTAIYGKCFNCGAKVKCHIWHCRAKVKWWDALAVHRPSARSVCCHHLWKEPVNAIHCGEKCDALYTFTHINIWLHIKTHIQYTHMHTFTHRIYTSLHKHVYTVHIHTKLIAAWRQKAPLWTCRHFIRSEEGKLWHHFHFRNISIQHCIWNLSRKKCT